MKKNINQNSPKLSPESSLQKLTEYILSSRTGIVRKLFETREIGKENFGVFNYFADTWK